MRQKRQGIAMYIRPGEMESRGYDQTAEGFTAYAREAMGRKGMEDCGMTLEVFSGEGGIMLFCEPHQRSVTKFVEFGRLLSAAKAVAKLHPAGSGAYRGEDGAWYLELRDEPMRLWRLAAAAREYGEASDVTPLWLGEHGVCAASRQAVEILAEL